MKNHRISVLYQADGIGINGKCNPIQAKHIYLESLGNDERKYMHTRIGTVKATHISL